MWGFRKLTSGRSDSLRYSRNASVTARTAVYGPVRTVVWQGSAGDRRPYADQTPVTSVAKLTNIHAAFLITKGFIARNRILRLYRFAKNLS